LLACPINGGVALDLRGSTRGGGLDAWSVFRPEGMGTCVRMYLASPQPACSNYGSQVRNNYCPSPRRQAVVLSCGTHAYGATNSGADIAMTAPRLPQVEALVERLAGEVAEPTRTNTAWLIEGVATAGKSTALRMLADGLRERGQVAVVAAPPAHALDAGPMALAELAGGLKDAGCVNGQTDVLRDGTMPLAEKIKHVREWIVNANDDVVLLLDEPSSWPDRFEQTQHFADHARLVVQELVRDIPCPRVLTGEAPEGMSFHARESVGAASEPQAFLTDSDVWGELTQAAGELQEGAADQLRDLSPLQLRLLVALTYVTSVDEVRNVLASGTRTRRALSRRLLDALKDNGGYKDLLRAWRRLAHIRRPFAEDLIGGAITGKLSKRSRALLQNCLLYEVDGRYLLHETLREDAHAIGPQSEREDYGQFAQLSRYYGGLRDDAEKQGGGEALPTALDSFYYAARAGDPGLLDREPYFVDQLDILGKTLSYELHRYEQAAEVFDRAVRMDDSDDYAYHYLAYNLDRLGREPERVELNYRGAIELNRTHPWWRARLVLSGIDHSTSWALVCGPTMSLFTKPSMAGWPTRRCVAGSFRLQILC